MGDLPDFLAPLRRAVEAGRLAHAYLLYGDHPHRLRGRVESILQALVCPKRGGLEACEDCEDCHQMSVGTHPDLVRLDDENPDTSITVDEIRDDVVQAASLTPVRGGYKFFWLQDVRRLTPEAANTLLKVLEEPPGEAVFLLTARSRWDCLPTIRSRCHWLRIPAREPTEAGDLRQRLEALWPDHDFPDETVRITRELLNNERRSDRIDWSTQLARGFLTVLLLMLHEEIREQPPSAGGERLRTSHLPAILDRFGELDRGVQPLLVINSLLEELFVPEEMPEWPVAS